MSKGKQTSTTKSEPWAPAQPYLKAGLGAASDLYNSGGMTIDYSGDWVADMTDGQKGALQNIIARSGGNTDTLQGLIGSLSSIAGGEQVGSWDTVAQDTIDRIMPGINSSFAGSGMTGSSLHSRAMGEGLSRGLATAHNEFSQQQFNNQLQAGSSIQQMLQQILGNDQAALDAETAFQTQAQNELDSERQTSVLQQGSQMEALSNYLAMISGIGGMGGTSTSTQKSSNGLLGTLGNIAQGVVAIGKMSDRRLKRDVKRVGATDDGLPIYTYRYHGSDTVHMGVMAQDVAEVRPEAVMRAGEYLAVNYGAL